MAKTSIVDRIRLQVGSRILGESGIKTVVSMSELSTHFDRLKGIGGPSSSYRNSRQYLNAYELASYLGDLTDIIASDIAAIPYFVVDKTGKEISDSRVEKMFSSPGENLTFDNLVKTSVIHDILDGNAFWLLDQPTMLEVRNGVFDIQILVPSTVDIYNEAGAIVSASTESNCKRVAYYRVRMDSIMRDLAPEMIIQTNSGSPMNVLRGMGVIQRNVAILDSDRMTTVFNNAFFANGARIQHSFVPEDDMTPKQRDELEKSIRESYQGVNNFFKLFISPVKGRLEEMSMKHDDMQYVDQKKLTKADVRNMLQVPPIILGGDEARYDSAEEQIRAYYQFTIPRHATPIAKSLTRLIRMILKRNDVEFVFNYPKIYNAQAIASAFDRGAVSQNELRETVGLPWKDELDFDSRYMTMQYLPVSQINDPTPPQEPKKSIQKKKITHDLQGRIYRRATRTKARIENVMYKDVVSYYSGMEMRVLEKLGSKALSVDDIFDQENEKNLAKSALNKSFTSGIVLGIQDVNEIFDLQIDDSMKNQKVRLSVEKLGIRYASSTIDSRRNEIRDIVQQSQAEGQPTSELSGRLKDYFSELKGENAWKAMRIARTESFHAWDQAAMIGYKELGVSRFDVIGCEDMEGDCNATGLTEAEADAAEFHPNHTGCLVPAID